MDVLIIILVFTLNVLVSNALAFLVTHSRMEIKVKPFNCYGCMAFWLTLIIGAMIAYERQGDALYYFIAVLSAFLNYFYVKSKYHVTL